MVMVGALGRKGPGEGVFRSSAMVVALWGLYEAEGVCWAGDGCERRNSEMRRIPVSSVSYEICCMRNVQTRFLNSWG